MATSMVCTLQPKVWDLFIAFRHDGRKPNPAKKGVEGLPQNPGPLWGYRQSNIKTL